MYGNTETRQVYKNFQLENLTLNSQDMSHFVYIKYLQYNLFNPPSEKNYFSHCKLNVNPTTPTNTDKGLFNVFPLDLMSDDLKTSTTSLGKLFIFASKAFYGKYK